MRQATISCATYFLSALFISATATAKPPKVEITTVLDGLHNPCGVAVQPGTGHVFVSDSGAGRIVRITKSGSEDAITGFPADAYGKGTYEEQTKFDIGPLGLAFLDKNTLVVGGGGHKDGSELLRIYEVPAAGKSIKAKQMKHSLGPIPAGDASVKGEGNFYGIATDGKSIFVTCNGDDTKGWVSKVDIKNGKPGKLTPFIKTKEATELDAPVGVTTNKEGHLVVGQMGEITVANDSLLSFYDAASGDSLMNLKTGLHDIASLAYNPKSGRLYAVDFAWGEHSADGGVFRLDSKIVDGKQTIEAVKVAKLDKPAAVAFGPNGAMYIAVFGSPEKGSNKKPGKLIKITGGL
jgi:DNA-binding beta-propeller fold protein YncE